MARNSEHDSNRLSRQHEGLENVKCSQNKEEDQEDRERKLDDIMEDKGPGCIQPTRCQIFTLPLNRDPLFRLKLSSDV